MYVCLALVFWEFSCIVGVILTKSLNGEFIILRNKWQWCLNTLFETEQHSTNSFSYSFKMVFLLCLRWPKTCSCQYSRSWGLQVHEIWRRSASCSAGAKDRKTRTHSHQHNDCCNITPTHRGNICLSVTELNMSNVFTCHIVDIQVFSVSLGILS